MTHDPPTQSQLVNISRNQTSISLEQRSAVRFGCCRFLPRTNGELETTWSQISNHWLIDPKQTATLSG